MALKLRKPGCRPRSASATGSAVLSRATSLRTLAGILRFDFFPEGFMGNAAPFSKPLSSGFQDRLQSRRVSHEQALNILLGLGAEQDRDRFALARHDDRTFLGSLDVFSKMGSDFALSCHFHSSTSSPPTNRRLPSFTPMAWIWTSRSSSSIP